MSGTTLDFLRDLELRIRDTIRFVEEREREKPQVYDPCSMGGCGKPIAARNFCPKHYRQWRKLECDSHGVKALRDIPKGPKVLEGQLDLFTPPASQVPEVEGVQF